MTAEQKFKWTVKQAVSETQDGKSDVSKRQSPLDELIDDAIIDNDSPYEMWQSLNYARNQIDYAMQILETKYDL